MRALAGFLGSKPCFFGDVATGFDAIAYGFLANILEVPIVSPVKEEGLCHPNLTQYLERMRARYWA